MSPFDYTLCDQTVTLYRLRDGMVNRHLLNNCYFVPEAGQKGNLHGKSRLKKFLLIIPGETDMVPGDRIYDGIGPADILWERFLPDTEENVYEIGAVKVCCWNGDLCHIQAKEAP